MIIRNISVILLFAIVFSMSTSDLSADVITIVHQRQEKKKNLRWTLTEWLRIKERMQLMDIWLAMVSNPAKDPFSVELGLHYNHRQLDNKLGNGSQSTDSTVIAREAQVSLMLDNLVSQSTGMRTLNIDFGLGAFAEKRDREVFGYGAIFRLFGDTNQDTALDFHIYYHHQSIDYVYGNTRLTGKLEGILLRTRFQFYLLSALGLHAVYDHYPTSARAYTEPMITMGGYRYEYGAFIEIAVIRITLTTGRETFRYQSDERFITQSSRDFSLIGSIYF